MTWSAEIHHHGYATVPSFQCEEMAVMQRSCHPDCVVVMQWIDS